MNAQIIYLPSRAGSFVEKLFNGLPGRRVGYQKNRVFG